MVKPIAGKGDNLATGTRGGSIWPSTTPTIQMREVQDSAGVEMRRDASTLRIPRPLGQ